MINFYADRATGLTVDELGSILQQYQTAVVPVLKKREQYYNGQQAILLRQPTDVGKPCNKIVTNFCENIVDTYQGYALGVPVKYISAQEGFENLVDILNYNDVADVDCEYFKNGLVYGRAAEIYYMDDDAKVRFKPLSPLSVIPVYDNTLEGALLYAIRFWALDVVEQEQTQYMVEVYDNVYRTTYKSQAGFSTFSLIDQIPHHFNQVPVTFFKLCEEEKGASDSIFSLQDAYNSLMSDSIDDWDAWCDAYLLLKGCTATDDDLVSMKNNRVLMMDADADATYLTKSTNTTEIQSLLERTEKKIREMSACPNFADESFGTASGVAIRYRLLQLENKTSSYLNAFKKALQRRIELLSGIMTLINGDALWRDVEIIFTRNLPTDMAEIITTVQGLNGIVSQETLLGQIPFVKNPADELLKVQAEKKSNLSIYDFGEILNEQSDSEQPVLDEESQAVI